MEHISVLHCRKSLQAQPPSHARRHVHQSAGGTTILASPNKQTKGRISAGDPPLPDLTRAAVVAIAASGAIVTTHGGGGCTVGFIRAEDTRDPVSKSRVLARARVLRSNYSKKRP